MLKLDLYIHSTGRIAPAADANDQVTKLLCAEPDYTSFINPMQLRRMSKAVRMGIGASKFCMDKAGITSPDALSIGTAMGCLQDTEFFLSKMVSQDEKMLTPTAFIQSTHNTVGGQIALLAGCKRHNMTYVHRGHSFEHAIINTKLYLNEHPGETVLAGAIDELTNGSHDLMQKAGFYTNTPTLPANFEEGNIAGEGASFFTINELEKGAILKIVSLQLEVCTGYKDALSSFNRFLLEAQINLSDIDLIVAGKGGDKQASSFYREMEEMPGCNALASFKQDCGEYATASAYALSVIADAVQNGESSSLVTTTGSLPTQLNKILLVNNYCDHYSYWLLERP